MINPSGVIDVPWALSNPILVGAQQRKSLTLISRSILGLVSKSAQPKQLQDGDRLGVEAALRG